MKGVGPRTYLESTRRLAVLRKEEAAVRELMEAADEADDDAKVAKSGRRLARVRREVAAMEAHVLTFPEADQAAAATAKAERAAAVATLVARTAEIREAIKAEGLMTMYTHLADLFNAATALVRRAGVEPNANEARILEGVRAYLVETGHIRPPVS
jgi:hypothetical protein